MLEFYQSVLALYVFIGGGFLLKKIFREKIDNKSLTIITVFFLQPFLAFWGFSQTNINFNIVGAGIIAFLAALFLTGGVFLFLSRSSKDRKMKTLIAFSGSNGNTGNMGIVLSGSIFGPVGIVTATMINFTNILWNFTFGVYFYARGEFSIVDSLKKILKMPLLWSSLVAVYFNLHQVEFSEKFLNFMEMGAHSSIVIQLFLFGLFLGDIRIKEFSWRLNLWTNFMKFILLPLVGFGIMLFWNDWFTSLSPFVMGTIILQLMMPLAVNNANLAMLYNCNPKKVTELTFTSSIIFFLISPFLFTLLEKFI